MNDQAFSREPISPPFSKEQKFEAAALVVPLYERLLGLPVWIVLAAMWVAGVALLGSCALALYVLISLLRRS